MTRFEALSILQGWHIPPGTNFYTLSSSQVSDVLEMANALKYRHPKNANGSKARYFYERVRRASERKDS